MGGLFGSGAPQASVEPRIGSLQVQNNGYGVAIPWVAGKNRIAATLFFYGNYQAKKIVTESEQGGKGGGMSSTTVSWEYSAAVALGVACHEINGIARTWIDKAVYAKPSNVGLSVFNGSQSQETWEYWASKEPDKAVSFKGFAYLSSANYRLNDNASLGNHSFEVVGLASRNTYGGDANIADFIVDFLVDQCGFPQDKIAGIGQFKAHCAYHGFFLSPALTEQRPAHEVLSEWLEIANATAYYSNGTLKFIPDEGIVPYTETPTPRFYTTQDKVDSYGNGLFSKFLNGQFYLVFNSALRPLYSTANGSQFIQSSAPDFSYNEWRDIAYAQTRDEYIFLNFGNVNTGCDFVMRKVGDTGSWGAVYVPVTARWRYIAESAGRYCAIPYSGTECIVSSDGVNWADYALPSNSGAWLAISSGTYAGRFVISGVGGVLAYTSNFGQTWTDVTNSTEITGICSGNSVFFALGNDGYYRVATDDGSATLTFGAAEKLPNTTSIMSCCAYVDGIYFAFSKQGGEHFYSSDLISWHKYPMPFDDIENCSGGNGRFIAVRAGGSEVFTILTETLSTYARDTGFTATPVFNLSHADFLADIGSAPVRIKKKLVQDAYNHIRIEFLNRNRGYAVEIVDAKDLDSINKYGLRQSPILKYHAICNPSLAKKVAQVRLQRELYANRLTYEFELSAKFLCLEPMDVVTLTDPLCGLNSKKVIVNEVGINKDYSLSVTASDFLPDSFYYLDQGYTGQGSVYVANSAVDVGSINPPVIFASPGMLKGTGSELWVAISSPDANFGGCEIHVSTDGGASYRRIASHDGNATMGTITNSFPSSPDPDTSTVLGVDLTISLGNLSPVSQSAVDQFESLCYVGGEFVAYRDATLTSSYMYDLEYFRRGLYTSPVGAVTGDDFVVCNSMLFRYQVPANYRGSTLKFKFPAHNSYRRGLQDISALPEYVFSIPA